MNSWTLLEAKAKEIITQELYIVDANVLVNPWYLNCYRSKSTLLYDVTMYLWRRVTVVTSRCILLNVIIIITIVYHSISSNRKYSQ